MPWRAHTLAGCALALLGVPLWSHAHTGPLRLAGIVLTAIGAAWLTFGLLRHDREHAGRHVLHGRDRLITATLLIVSLALAIRSLLHGDDSALLAAEPAILAAAIISRVADRRLLSQSAPGDSASPNAHC